MPAIDDTSSAIASLNATRKQTTNPKGKLKVEDFIKMMVTQLQNQDPTEPAKNGELLQQMSQIGALQSQEALQSSLKTLVSQNNIGSASNLIGKNIEGVDGSSGETISGTVKSVRVVKGDVVLRLESGIDLPMGQISSITDQNAAGTADLRAAIGSSANATIDFGG